MTSRTYAVTVMASIPKPVDLDDLHAELQKQPLGAAVAGVYNEVTATMTIAAVDTETAHQVGVEKLTKALAAVGLKKGPVGILEVQVLTPEEQDRRNAEPLLPQLAGVAEIAQRLGVSKQRVDQLRQREDFPRPLVTLKAGPVWTADSLNHFIEGWARKPGRPRGDAPERVIFATVRARG